MNLNDFVNRIAELQGTHYTDDIKFRFNDGNRAREVDFADVEVEVEQEFVMYKPAIPEDLNAGVVGEPEVESVPRKATIFICLSED